MKFPHQYVTNANSNFEGSLIVSTENLELEITPPSQFGGEDKHWSPEDLFSAGVASCFILTLKALSKSKKMPWICVDVVAKCHLDKGEDGLAFYNADLFVNLRLARDTNEEDYLNLLHLSEKECLFSNSLKTKISLYPELKRE